jgi:hypothetical protein
MDMLRRHAATIHEVHEDGGEGDRGTWIAGESDEQAGRRQTWEPPAWQTYYPPEHETVTVEGAQEEERACMGLSPATDRDNQMADTVVVTINQDIKQREHEASEGAEPGKYDPQHAPMELIRRGGEALRGSYWATGGGHEGDTRKQGTTRSIRIQT